MNYPLSSLLLLLSSAPALAQEQVPAEDAPIAALLAELGEDVRAYNEHVTFLANPFLEGRLPGTRGMEIATEYVEAHFDQAGLERPVEGDSYRQSFPVGKRRSVTESYLAVGLVTLTHGVDFGVTGMGGSGAATAPLVFCGYGIEKGQEGYRGFEDGVDLTGKVAMIMRFEPMDEEGKSLWATRGPWTAKSGFSRKLKAAEERGAVGVLLVSPPGAADDRVGDLMLAGRGSRSHVQIPVLMATSEAATLLLTEAGVAPSLMDLRREADAHGVVRDLGCEIEIQAQIADEELSAENVIGLLRGKGSLASEYLVLGAHLDHLGMGNFGSREGPGKLHPGADDNASGSAAVIMLAKRLAAEYRELPPDGEARSVLFMCFSAEESGLIGSSYYCRNPLFPIEQHKLMINFDMIGRIADKRLSVSGASTGEGMAEWLAPMFEASPLTIVQPENMSGASDHTPFYRAKMPVLFGIIADFHDDYHTSRDVVSKINRVDAVHTINLFHNILRGAALRDQAFAYAARARRGVGGGDARRTQPPAAPAPRVFVGVVTAESNTQAGVVIGTVIDGAPADQAGIKEGDLLTKWAGKALKDEAALRNLLAGHTPGDRVQVTVQRDGAEKVFWLTLGGR
ncbi:MAG: M28 family peptidase [Planctomycetota bacterium]|nr:M28 family peptidase [Planctomycetota bacterium]